MVKDKENQARSQILPQNQLFYGDNLEILQKFIATESIDLCYIDPPFNSKRNYNQIYTTDTKSDTAQSQAFVDTWSYSSDSVQRDHKFIKENPNYFGVSVYETIQGFEKILGRTDLFAYLVSMCVRMREIHRVLKPTGSFYLHCDPTASHYLKILLDAIFGEKNFRNEIVWQYPQSIKASKNKFLSNFDCLFFYTKSDNYNFFNVEIPYTNEQLARFKHEDEKGKFYFDTRRNSKGEKVKVKVYLKKSGTPTGNVWYFNRAQGKEYLGYPTQKPLALLERIIQASSRESDVVLDAFCGCGTTIDASVRLGRKFIGIDITYQSISLILKRLAETHGEACVDEIVQHGIPKDIESAKALKDKKDDRLRKEFEKWAVLTYTNNKGIINEKKGSDGGVDGILFFGMDGEHKAIIQVKSGKVGDKDIKDLATTIKDEGAKCGFFLTLEEPTKPMIDRANQQGKFDIAEATGFTTAGRTDYPVITIITIEDMMNGARVELPIRAVNVIKTATRVNNKETTDEMDF